MSGVAWAQAAPPPASAFGRIPAIQDIAISPNGQTIATLGGTPTQRMLTFATIDKPGLPTLDLGAVKALGVDWVGDSYAVAESSCGTKAAAPRPPMPSPATSPSPPKARRSRDFWMATPPPRPPDGCQ